MLFRSPTASVLRNADEKGEWVFAHVRSAIKTKPRPRGFIVISADTIVVLGDDILEKPRDPADAAVMLSRLSGQVHTVYSGVTLLADGGGKSHKMSFVVTTEVRIKDLSQAEIQAYIRTGEPLDKAGGYAAQGIGSYMVKNINGSYANVVGLPIAEVVECLTKDFGYPLWRS